MNNDRITELYMGEISSKEGQRIGRDRIDWMCTQIRGERVLDIGCSQGILSVLAARAGHTVVGVDIEEPAIEYARRALQTEPAEVRDRISFVLGDILAHDLGGDRFDTVLLGEILEHHADPRRLFERAVGFLAERGVIVVTTPFGNHPHDDHRFTFYLSDFMRTIDGLCQPSELDIVDGYIRFVGRHRDADPATRLALDPAELLFRSEKAFLLKERVAHDRLVERKRLLLRVQAEARRSATKAEALAADVKRLADRLERLRARYADLMRERKELRQQLRAARKLPPILPPPPDAGPLTRSLSMALGSVQHEIHNGRALKRPHVALVKTLVRVNKAFRGVPVVKRPAARPAAPNGAAQHGQRPAQATKGQLPTFAPFEPRVTAPASSIRIATILDTFSASCFRYEADLLPLSVDAWQQEMEEHRPAFLLAESAWQGNGGQWRYLMTKYASRPQNPLRDLLAWCKGNGITRVFWNKEDPAHFEVFKDVARDFDVVFTTDANCIPRYRELLGHDRVYALPFAAQPAIHNPMQHKVKRTGTVCFAGSWRADRYPERVADSEALLTPALDFGLDIFDRHAGSDVGEKLQFPPPYRDAVRGSLDYPTMLSAYRGYKVFLNVNSVKDSPTMFARRVFELMACGTPVISSESVGIRAMLGTLVKIASTPEEARTHLERLLGDPDYRDRFAHAGYREVMQYHTYSHRLATILNAIGLGDSAEASPLVTILAATNRPENLPNLLASVRRQIYPNIELLLLLNSDEYDLEEVSQQVADYPRAQAVKLPESRTLAECLNHGIERSQGAWIAKFDDDDYYGAHYLSDLMLARRYTDARILGKRSYYSYVESANKLALRFPGHAHRHVEFVPGATLLVRRDVFDEVRFTPVSRGTDTIFQEECRERGINIYSADPYNLIVMRRANPSAHTWRIDDEAFLANCRVIGDGLDVSRVMI